MAKLTQLKDDFTYHEHELNIIKLWKDIDIYNKIIEKNINNKIFHFMDGPPFVSSSTLHFGHILIGIIKNTMLNFKQMHGYNCLNKLGYDVHGLPTEQCVNKILNVYTKKEVDEIGIDTYNTKCKQIINEYSNDWKPVYERIGRFADFNNTYKTMDINFMESVWFHFKQLYNKNLIYRNYKVMPYCYKCTTTLSNFEAGQNYKDINEQSIYVKFEIINDNFKNTKFIAWTTTPWTLPSNVALCLNPHTTYILINLNSENIIVAESCISNIISKNESYTIINTFKGVELQNIKYKPLFNYYTNNLLNIEYKTIIDEFVKDEKDEKDEKDKKYKKDKKDKNATGSGIVHLAPIFGEQDMTVCIDNNIIKFEDIDNLMTIDDNGCFIDKITDFSGINIFEANKLIIQYLNKNNNIIKIKDYFHRYPYCSRSDNPLIYKASPSYFMNVNKIKEQLLKNHEKTTWVPQNIGENRFKNWLKNAIDWNISRTRYFGTPIPLWVSDDGDEVECVGSIDELMEKTFLKERPIDIHLENIMNLQIPSKTGKGFLKPINVVFDCWFESGCVPFAQYHYPFENKNLFDNKSYLSDFIAEGLDQTRGWFYTLMVLSTALFDKPAFKNVICSGLILAKDGKKMSKSLGNFENPLNIINEFGIDSIRLYLLNSPSVKADSLLFDCENIKQSKSIIIQWYNCVKFFIEHAIDFQKKGLIFKYIKSNNIIDMWILSKIGTLIENIELNMDNYQLDKIVPLLIDFIENITNWYIKFSRDRLKGIINDHEWNLSLITMLIVIFNFIKITTPFIPFLSEMLYQQLKPLIHFIDDNTHESIHLYSYPLKEYFIIDNEIERKMTRLQTVSGIVRSLRNSDTKCISNKFPLKNVIIANNDNLFIEDIKCLEEYLCEEINYISIQYVKLDGLVLYKPLPNNSVLGKKYKDKKKDIIEKIGEIDQLILCDFMNDNIDHIQITVFNENIHLTKNELNIDIEIKQCDELKNLLTKVENNTIVGITKTPEIIDDEVLNIYRIRLIIVGIQQLRKNSNLRPWNDIIIYYKLQDNSFLKIIQLYYDKLFSKIKYPIYNFDEYNITEYYTSHTFDIYDMSISLFIVKLN
jgi:isoleucyl-tRNA synthetase